MRLAGRRATTTAKGRSLGATWGRGQAVEAPRKGRLVRAPNGASVVGPTSPGPTRRSPALATPITTRSPVGSPREHLVLAVEDLHVRNLIRSARGTVKHPRHPGSPEGGM